LSHCNVSIFSLGIGWYVNQKMNAGERQTLRPHPKRQNTAFDFCLFDIV
jgi:hypothetical protein